MYGDSDVMHRRAAQLREQGVDIRALADQLVARTESLGWTGRAAQSMRERIQERAGHLRAAAAEHDTAADSLDKHAHDVAATKEVIAETERRATTLVAEARTRVARVATDNEADPGLRRVADPDDEALAAFDPPPSGHKDWLTVELPGL